MRSMYIGINLEGLLGVAARNLPESIEYYSSLTHIRQVAHELNRNLSYGEAYKEYVTQHLRTRGLDFMQNEIAGVNIALRLYEKASGNKVAQRKQWFTQGDIKEIEDEVKKIFDQMAERKTKDGKTEDGILKKEGRNLTKWERDRALLIAKVFFAGTQRLAMYAALGDLPSDAMTTDRIASLPYEYIARAIVPFKMVAPRFFASARGPKRFMELIFEEQNKKAEYVGLFGLDPRTIMMDGNGALDPESHGWRSQMMFLGNAKVGIKVKEGEKEKEIEISLLQHLNEQARKHGKTPKDPVLGGGDVKKPEFSKEARDVVLGQRLYLSVLGRYGNFDDSLKTQVWEKIALLKPSTMASLMPQIIENRELWEEMRTNVYIQEEKRVEEDAKRSITTAEDMKQEKARFERAVALGRKSSAWTDAERQEILAYIGFTIQDFAPDKQRVLESIIKNGLKQEPVMAKAKMPFTFVIDDAPHIAWKKTGEGITGLADEDLLRILISDQKSFTEAWTEVNGLVESPTEHVVEHISKAVDGIGLVIGRNDAQDILEPFIIAWLRFAQTHPAVLYTPGAKSVLRLLRQPTSEMEKYYRSKFISMDEEEKADVTQALIQAKAIRDNTIDLKDGLTQLDRIRKKTKSDRLSLFLRMARIMIFLFGAATAYEFLQMVIPEEIRGK